MTSAFAHYIAEPIQVNFGTEVSSGNVASGIDLICYMDGQVKVGSTYIDYKAGDAFTTSATTTIQSGIFVKDFVNTDLPPMLHQEIAKRTASLLSGSVENYDRVIDIENRIEDRKMARR